MRWIATNAGHEGSIVVQKVQSMKGEEGFHAQTETYGNLVQAGVIDPAKVVRSALQHAASIASLLLTTEAVITQLPEKNKNAAMRHERRHVLRSSGVTLGEPLFNSHGGKPRARRAGNLTGGRPIWFIATRFTWPYFNCGKTASSKVGVRTATITCIPPGAYVAAR